MMMPWVGDLVDRLPDALTLYYEVLQRLCWLSFGIPAEVGRNYGPKCTSGFLGHELFSLQRLNEMTERSHELCGKRPVNAALEVPSSFSQSLSSLE